MKWRIPQMWSGATVFVIGGGPSVAGADLCLSYRQRRHLFSHRVIGVNNAGFLDNGVDLLFFGDAKWYDWNKDRVQQHTALVATSHPQFEHYSHILYLQRTNKAGYRFRSPDVLPWNGSSGGSAIALAAMLGAYRIVLVGFDMRSIAGVKNFHKEHLERPTIQDSDSADPYRPRFLRFLSKLEELKERLDRQGIETINTTPDSALTVFPFRRLTDVLEG